MSPPLPRFRSLDRSRVSTASLEELLPADHSVRFVWAFVVALDLSSFARNIRAVEGRPGSPPFRPDVLFALWLFATCEGIASARELAQRCQRDLPYQWLCGGDAPNYHTLADFYSRHSDRLQAVFVEHIAALRQQELIDLHRVTLDGRKVPVAATTEAFHREATLQRHLQEAAAQVQAVQQQRDQLGLPLRQQRARERAVRQRHQRVQAALVNLAQVQEQRRQSKRTDRDPAEARASETDPECRRMKMKDGGFRLAYNVQTVTDVKHQLIVTVDVSNQGSDTGLLEPLRQRVIATTGQAPREMLVDSGYADGEDIARAEQGGTVLYLPPRDERKEKASGKDPYQPKRRDTPVLATWRQRMGTVAAQALYRQRAPVAEGVHAQQANRGWRQLRLRGLVKVRGEVWWQALAYNVLRLRSLAREGKVRAEVT